MGAEEQSPTPALRPPEEVLRERGDLARAALDARGIEIVASKDGMELVSPPRLYIMLSVPRSWPSVIRLGSPAGVEPVLERHGFHVVYYKYYEDEDGEALLVQFEIDKELNSTREHAVSRTLVQERLPLVVSELSSLEVDIIEARHAVVPAGGVLELRRSTFSKLGLSGPTGLEPEFDRCGLHVTKVKHSTSGDQRLLELSLELHAELDWTRSLPFTTEVIAVRLAEVAAEFAARGAEVVSSHVEQGAEKATGRLLLRGSPPPSSAQPADLEVSSDFVVSFNPHGWALKERGRYHRLESGIGSSARTIVNQAWWILREEARREKARRDEPTERIPDQALALPDWGPIAATIIIVPFVQALAGKFADDVYAKLRTFFHRRSVQDVAMLRALFDGEPAVERGGVIIRDPDAGTELVVPGPLPDKAIKQLVRLGPERIRGQTLIWNEADQTWRLAGD
jgi:hypothetical protein